MVQPTATDPNLTTIYRLASDWPSEVILTADLHFMPCATWFARSVSKISCGCYDPQAPFEKYKKINYSQQKLREIVCSILQQYQHEEHYRSLCLKAITSYNAYIDAWQIGLHHRINFSELLLARKSTQEIATPESPESANAKRYSHIQALDTEIQKTVALLGLNPHVFKKINRGLEEPISDSSTTDNDQIQEIIAAEITTPETTPQTTTPELLA